MKIELSRYTTNSINIQRKANGYIPNGMDNLFPNYLDGLYSNSPTHQCVVDDLTGYIIGQGLISDNILDEAIIKKFFNNNFLTRLERLRKIHNAVCLEIVRNALNRIVEINIINPSQIRVDSISNGVPAVFRFKKSWDTSVNHNYTTGQEIPTYDQFSPRSLLYWYDSGIFDLPYGRPSYLSATDPIEFEISLYMGDNHGAQNGMTPSAIITMPTSGDPEQDIKDTNAINNSLSGVANKGKTATVHTKAGETVSPTITLLNDNSKESKQVNYQVAESGILKGWRIPSPTLISGLNIKPTGFGDAEAEMQWALNTLKSKVVEPNRVNLLEILNPLFSELELKGELSFIDGIERNESVQEEVQENVSTELVNDNIKNLTGRQFQNIERIVRKFKKGLITKAQAKLTLKGGYGFTDEEAETWLQEEFTQLSKHITLDQIIEQANSIEDFEGWEIESIEDAAGTQDEESIFLEQNVKLAKTGTARPNSESNQDGNKGNVEYKIRYRYSGDRTGQREFCNKMLKANKIYRYEDIVNMSFANVNAGFGPKGASNYDIFSWKGGKYCHHKFERITFVNKKGDGIDAKSPIAQDKALSESMADRRGMTPTGTAKTKQRTSETRPIDMPNRGAYTLSKLKELINKI